MTRIEEAWGKVVWPLSIRVIRVIRGSIKSVAAIRPESFA